MNFVAALSYSARALFRASRFTVTIVLVLTVAIAINTTFFSLFDQLVLRPFPYHAPKELVMIWQSNPALGGISAERFPATSLDLDAWRRENRSFQGIEALQIQLSYNLTGLHSPERVKAARVTAGLFQLLGVNTSVGRPFVSGDDKSGANQVVIPSYDFARRHFGDNNPLGRRLLLDDEPFTIVGVLPKDFHLPALYQGIAEYKPDIWIPLPEIVSSDPVNLPKRHRLIVCGRLKAGVSLAAARADMNSLADRLARENPELDRGYGINVFSLDAENTDPDLRNELTLMIAAAALVLLLAWANLTGLMFVRACSRRKHMAIMAALGADRWELMMPIVCESMLLAIISGVLGWLLSDIGVHLIAVLKPSDIHAPERLALSANGLLLAFSISLLSVVAVGLFPSVYLMRRSLSEGLKRDGGSSSGRSITRRVLIGAQIATALALTISAILLVQSFATLMRVDPGFRAEKVLTARLSLSQKRYKNPADQMRFCQALREKLQSLPGVKSAALVDNMPLYAIGYSAFEVEGRPIPERNQAPSADYARVTPGFFNTMDVSLHEGRLFTDQDAEFNPPRVVIINEALAHKLWPGEEALGKHIRELPFNGVPGPWQTVIGIVHDFRQFNIDTPARPELFRPAKEFVNMTIVLRTTGPAVDIGPSLQKAVWSIDRNEPVSDIQTLSYLVHSLTSQREFNMFVVSAFAAFSILLTVVGVYGIMSSFIADHLREIGIRLALGIQRTQLCRALTMLHLPEVLMGLGGGLVLSFCAKRIIASTLFHVNPLDVRTYIFVPTALLLLFLVTNVSASLRAAWIDPATVLKGE